VTRYKKFYAHDENNKAKAGDQVRIQECPPKSKLKRWELLEVVGG
jgi:small subunit ribosomal protein S17